MFILNHIPLVLIIGLLLFVIFTWANIFEKSGHFITSTFLTYIFLKQFLTSPVKSVNREFANREVRLKSLEENSRLTTEEKNKIINAFNSKRTLYLFFMKKGVFSYSTFMQAFLQCIEDVEVKVSISLKQEQHSHDKIEPTMTNDIFQHIFNH